MSQWANHRLNLKRKKQLGYLRLMALFLAALAIGLWIFDFNNTDADALFQSPASPPAQESPVAAPSEQQPAQQPAAEQQPAQQPAEQSQSQQSTSSEQTSQSDSSAPEASPELSTINEPPPLPEPTSIPRTDNINQDDSFIDEEENGSSNFILDRVEFVDSMVVSGAYVWLCCGAVFLLIIPLAFLLLQIRGQIKIRREENY